MVPLVAVLVRLSDGHRFVVPAQCMVGRSPSCHLVLDDRYASSEHAKLSWTGHAWRIRDLGSRNGTFVDGQRIEPGRPVPVRAHAQIGFGESEASFEMQDVSAPGAFAVDLEAGAVHPAVGEVLLLPNDRQPELTVYPDPNGTGWLAENNDGEKRSVEDRSVITAGGRPFRVELPVLVEATPMVDVAFTLENANLRFAVSSDEETVEIGLYFRGEEKARLEAREHSYLLLTLARARWEDRGRDVKDRGWRRVDEVLRMLRVDQNALNVAIHRARQQFAALGLEGAAGIVETARGRRRLGTDRFEIVALG